MRAKIIVVGSGLAGLTASYVLGKSGYQSVIIEKESEAGGLSKSFPLCGEWFDIAAHVEFAKSGFVREVLETGIEYREFPFVPYNYKKGLWIKHPVQNNLFVLDTDEKVEIIKGFVEKPQNQNTLNYKEWLCASYGKYFSDNYPACYTRKYWTVEPELLRTEWAAGRMYRPNIEEVLRGAFTTETENIHYSHKVRYPKEGGFASFLKNLLKGASIECGMELKEICTTTKELLFSDGSRQQYDYVINTAPIKELIKCLKNVPDSVKKAADGLHATSLVLVSMVINGKPNIGYSTVYIYDEDILSSRVYSTTAFSGADNGKSTVQAEVYYSDFKPAEKDIDEIRARVVSELSRIGMIDMGQVLTTDVRLIPYANIMFTGNIYRDRKTVRDYIEGCGIVCAGRFGEWDYLWSDQAVLSGKRAAEQVIGQMEGGEKVE